MFPAISKHNQTNKMKSLLESASIFRKAVPAIKKTEKFQSFNAEVACLRSKFM